MTPEDRSDAAVFVAGHGGMVGSAIVRELGRRGYRNIVTCKRAELDLTRQSDVQRFFAARRIDHVYLAAAKVGGIHANNAEPAEFIYDNLAIELNLIDSAHRAGVQRLLFLGSSCIYPRLADQPLREEALLTGTLEPTNEPYAVAKIAGIKLCESYNRQYGRDYRSVMPTNLYGPGDNFDPENGHVIPALMRRMHQARVKQSVNVPIWGSGRPRREFLHVDDLAAASVHVMELDPAEWNTYTTPVRSHLNVGAGRDCTILELAEMLATIVGYGGDLVFDTTRPDGTPRKLLDVSRIEASGWKARIDLRSGLEATYQWFLDHHVHSGQVAISGGATPGVDQ